jgi:hypothetical protein
MVSPFTGEHTRRREERHYRRIIGIVIFAMDGLHYRMITQHNAAAMKSK